MIFNIRLNEFAAKVAIENTPFPIKTPKEYNLRNYTELAAKIMDGVSIGDLHPTYDLMEIVADNLNIATQTIKGLISLENTEYLCELCNVVNFEINWGYR